MKKIGLISLILIGAIFVINTVKADDITNQVEIINVDASTGNPIVGSKLVLTDEAGNIIDEWITTENKHYVYNLKVGKYTLTQTETPAGYSAGNNSIIFEVETNDKTISLTIDNTKADNNGIDQEITNVPDTFSSTKLIYIISAILTIIGALTAYNYATIKENE